MTDRQLLQKLFTCIDHTTLTSVDNEASVEEFCRGALALGLPDGDHVAAVCVYPRFVAVAARTLRGSGIGVASVAGAFPHGQLPIGLKEEEVSRAVADGADEVDIVINRGLLLEGKDDEALSEVRAMRNCCKGKLLKVIVETCDLPSPTLLSKATRIAIDGGADFVKTSTGKGAAGATLEAAEVMLQEVHLHWQQTGRTVGFKAAGGIRTPDEATAFARLAMFIMGDGYIHPSTFRIGASRLTESLREQIVQKR